MSCGNNQNKKSTKPLDYYEVIINDFSTQSYYLALDVKPLNDTSFTILIQNGDLWYILKDEKKYTLDKYKLEVRNLLINNNIFYLDSSLEKRLSKYRFQVDCTGILQQDVQSIKERYFDKGKLKLQFESNNNFKNCIVYAFYMKQVPIRNNDESGLLEIQ